MTSLDSDRIADIYALLYQMGAAPTYRGFAQAAYAVLISLEEPECLSLATKTLYPDVARQYNTSWKAVERNIRTLIAHIWGANPDFLAELAQYPLVRKPTPTQFISILVAHISYPAA